MHGQSMKKHCLESNSTGLASQAQRLYVCCKKGLGNALNRGRPPTTKATVGDGCCLHESLQTLAILGILASLEAPPMPGGPDGSSHYTCDLPPPRGRTRRGRPGWLPAMFHGGPPHLWAEMRATHSSPPLSSSVRDRTGNVSGRGPRSVLASASSKSVLLWPRRAAKANEQIETGLAGPESWDRSLPPSSGRAIAAGGKGTRLRLYLPLRKEPGAGGPCKNNKNAACCAPSASHAALECVLEFGTHSDAVWRLLRHCPPAAAACCCLLAACPAVSIPFSMVNSIP